MYTVHVYSNNSLIDIILYKGDHPVDIIDDIINSIELKYQTQAKTPLKELMLDKCHAYLALLDEQCSRKGVEFNPFIPLDVEYQRRYNLLSV